MIFTLDLDTAKSLTQQDKLRQIARALSHDYAVLHYDDALFVCSGDIPEGANPIEFDGFLYLVNVHTANALAYGNSFALIASSDPSPAVIARYGFAKRLSDTGIVF